MLTTIAICRGTKYSSNSQLGGGGEAELDEYHMATSPIHCNTVHTTDGLHNSSQLMCHSSMLLLHFIFSPYKKAVSQAFSHNYEIIFLNVDNKVPTNTRSTEGNRRHCKSKMDWDRLFETLFIKRVIQ